MLYLILSQNIPFKEIIKLINLKKHIIMKKIFTYSTILLSFLLVVSCGPKLPKGQKTVELPCFQEKYTSSKKDFGASGRGVSIDQVTSRKKGMMNAKSEIASLIKSNIRSLTDDYSVSRSVGNKEEFKSRFETITSETVNEMLTDIKVACQVLAFDKNTGQYNTYIALSISKDRTAQQVMQKLSNKEKKELDMDYEKFRSLLDKDVTNNN